MEFEQRAREEQSNIDKDGWKNTREILLIVFDLHFLALRFVTENISSKVAQWDLWEEICPCNSYLSYLHVVTL